MNTPTPRTDASTYPADCLGKTLVTNRDLARALERELTALTAERDQLRAEADQKRNLLVIALRSAGDQETRASRAETELATERARLDWLEGNAGDIPKYNSRSFIWFANQNIRAAIDAGIKEDAK